jgi:hypothetical protein
MCFEGTIPSYHHDDDGGGGGPASTPSSPAGAGAGSSMALIICASALTRSATASLARSPPAMPSTAPPSRCAPSRHHSLLIDTQARCAGGGGGGGEGCRPAGLGCDITDLHELVGVPPPTVTPHPPTRRCVMNSTQVAPPQSWHWAIAAPLRLAHDALDRRRLEPRPLLRIVSTRVSIYLNT